MTRAKRTKRGPVDILPPAQSGAVPPAEDDQQLAMSQQSPDIPPHVWAILQDAGELAAGRLRDLLASPRFTSFRGSEQKALIELALTRAYGLPVRRSLSVNLESSDADAIAASLMGLSDALPERQSDPVARNSGSKGAETPDKDRPH